MGYITHLGVGTPLNTSVHAKKMKKTLETLNEFITFMTSETSEPFVGKKEYKIECFLFFSYQEFHIIQNDMKYFHQGVLASEGSPSSSALTKYLGILYSVHTHGVKTEF